MNIKLVTAVIFLSIALSPCASEINLTSKEGFRAGLAEKIRHDDTIDTLIFPDKEFSATELYAHEGHKNTPPPRKKGKGKCQHFPNLHTQKMSHVEVCQYSASCPKEKIINKIMMYCTKENKTECNTAKAWVHINALLNIPEETFVSGTSQQQLDSEGKGSHRICARID